MKWRYHLRRTMQKKDTIKLLLRGVGHQHRLSRFRENDSLVFISYTVLI